MPVELFANTAQSTLSAGIISTDLTLSVATAASFPAASSSASPPTQFRVRVEDAPAGSGINLEYMTVTNVSGTTFTVTRGGEGTTAISHGSGSAITHVVTASAMASWGTSGDDLAFISRLPHFGHSFSFGTGASGPDKDSLTRLAASLKAREVPDSRAGAALIYQNTNPVTSTNGGYNTVANQARRRKLPHGTVRTAASAGATSVDVGAATDGVWANAQRVIIGKGTNSNAVWVFTVSGTSPTQTLNLMSGLTNAVSIGDPVWVIPNVYEAPDPLVQVWFGINDINQIGTGNGGTAIQSGEPTYKRTLEATIAYLLTAGDSFYDANHASTNRSTNAAASATAGVGMGLFIRAMNTVGNQVTIDLGADFPGGDFYVFFTYQHNGGSNITFTVDGVSSGSLDLRNLGPRAGIFSMAVKVFNGLAAGAHVIVGTVANAGTQTYYNGHGIRAEVPPVIVLPGMNRPVARGYNTYTNANSVYERVSGTLTANHGIGVASFTISAPLDNAAAAATLKAGELITLSKGTGNEETLTIAADATGTTVTTTTNSTKAHNTSEIYEGNVMDAAITQRAINWIPAVISSGLFPSSIIHVPLEDLINANDNYFYYDGLHFNDRGFQIISDRIFNTIRYHPSMVEALEIRTNTPIAPLAGTIYFLGPLAAGAAASAPGAGGAVTVAYTNNLAIRDLRRCAYARLHAFVTTAGAANSRARVEYSLDGGTTWKTLGRSAVWTDTAIGTASENGQIDISSTGRKDTGWFRIPSDTGSVTECQFRFVHGNASTTTPSYQYVVLEFS